MKKYFAITFLCRDDAIEMKNWLYRRKICSSLIGAPECIISKCSYILSIQNIDALQIKKILNFCDVSFKDIYYVEVSKTHTFCQKI